MSNDSYDFTPIMAHVLEVCAAAFIHSECVYRYSQSSIAVAATILTLEHVGFKTFTPQWLEFVRTNFPDLNFDEVAECKKFILVKVAGNIESPDAFSTISS